MNKKRERQPVAKPQTALDRKEQARRRYIRALRGKYAFVQTSSEEFLRRKHLESLLER